jgi:hypothetical protein
VMAGLSYGQAKAPRPPVIDVHLHSESLANLKAWGPNPWTSPQIEQDCGKQIMFGSDQMTWPDGIGIAIEWIEQANFLTAEQKRDILYNNASRFLRLSPEQIARHHAAQ